MLTWCFTWVPVSSPVRSLQAEQPSFPGCGEGAVRLTQYYHKSPFKVTEYLVIAHGVRDRDGSLLYFDAIIYVEGQHYKI